jgi:hypothetical protein
MFRATQYWNHSRREFAKGWQVRGTAGAGRPARLQSVQKPIGGEFELKLESIEPHVSVVTDCVGNSDDASDAAKWLEAVPHAPNDDWLSDETLPLDCGGESSDLQPMPSPFASKELDACVTGSELGPEKIESKKPKIPSLKLNMSLQTGNTLELEHPQ